MKDKESRICTNQWGFWLVYKTMQNLYESSKTPILVAIAAEYRLYKGNNKSL